MSAPRQTPGHGQSTQVGADFVALAAFALAVLLAAASLGGILLPAT
jgi:hypothetical protein